MNLDEVITELLALGERLPSLLGADWGRLEPDASVLLADLAQERDRDTRRFLVDALIDLLSPYAVLAASLEPIAAGRRWSRESVPRGFESDSRDRLTVAAGAAILRERAVEDEILQLVRSDPPTIQRQPHLTVDADEPIAVGTRFTATVHLDAEAALPGEEGGPITLPNLGVLELRVWLIASDHFTIDGAATAMITVRSGRARSTSATFALQCTAAAPGAAGITATFAYGGRPAGSVWRSLDVQGSADRSPSSLPAPAVHVDPRARPAHLVIRVLQDPDGAESHYQLTFSSSLLDEYADGVTVPFRLRMATREFVEYYMAAFTGANPAGRKAALIGAGKQLWRATPVEFQQAFWRLAEQADPGLETIFVVTSEPYLPWELMIPNDGAKVGRPLGVDYAVGRWVHRQHVSPRQDMPIVDSSVIAPRYRGSRALSFSADEARHVLELFSGEQISPAILTNIDAELGRRGTTLVHLICHGVAGATGQILELDADEQLLDLQLEGLDGVISAFAEKQPFVFINACEVGRVTPALVGSGGFAAAFTRLGARCVIAPIWSVKDSVAGEVARTFYDAVHANPTVPFASVMRDIRRRAYEGPEPEDSYAAYCFYGDPLAAQVTR